MARQRAALIVARANAGEDPVGELAQRWLEEHVGTRCEPSTAETYRLTVKKHIVPALGRKPALAI